MDEAKLLVLFAKSAFVASNSLSDLFGFLWKLIHLDFSLKRPMLGAEPHSGRPQGFSETLGVFLRHSPKRPVQQRLKQMLRLPLGFPLLGAQPAVFLDDFGELLLEWERRLDKHKFLKF